MKTILFTNARDEDNILEWVVHHIHLGFSHIFITDHKSIKPVSEVLKKIPPNLVSVYRENGDITKNDLIYKAHRLASSKGFDWMLYLDCDEFLTLNKSININDFLGEYAGYDQVGINWLCFGTNNLDTFNGTIMESFTRCDDILNVHIKTFLHLTQNTRSINIQNPHVYILNDMSKSVGTDHQRLSIAQPHFHNNNNSTDFNRASAYICHYIFQSYEMYVKRKINLPRDDCPNEKRDIFTREQLHSMFNSRENLKPMEKYNANNKFNIKTYGS
jgi:hypothetical protein